jgi:hypothetical protein
MRFLLVLTVSVGVASASFLSFVVLPLLLAAAYCVIQVKSGLAVFPGMSAAEEIEAAQQLANSYGKAFQIPHRAEVGGLMFLPYLVVLPVFSSVLPLNRAGFSQGDDQRQHHCRCLLCHEIVFSAKD